MAQISKEKIIFDRDDWMAGLHQNYSLSVSSTPIPSGDKLATAMLSFNPFRQGSFGYAAPGYPVDNVTNASVVTDSPLRRIELAFDTDDGAMHGFAINSNNKLFRMDATNGDLDNDASWPHTITGVGGTAEANDIAVYTSDVGASSALRVFYSYNNIGDNTWDIGMYALDGTAPVDDFMSTVPAVAGGSSISFSGENNPHPMIVSDVDDVLYFADGNIIYGYDGAVGANGEIFEALVLQKTFRIQSFAKLNQRLVIFGYFQNDPSAAIDNLPYASTNSKAYWWDYSNLDPYDSVDLSDSFVTCAFQYKSTIGCFTQGRPGSVGSLQPAKLRLYNGSIFETVATFDANGSNAQNALPFNGGYDTLGDCIIWNSLGTVYQYGPSYPGYDSKMFKIVEGSENQTGAIRILDQETVVLSSGLGTSGGLQRFEVTTSDVQYAEGFFRTELAEPNFPSGYVAKMKSVKISFADTADADGLDLVVSVIGNNTPYTTVNQFSQVTNSSIVSEFYYDAAGAKLPYFNDIAVTLEWVGATADQTPIPESVEIYYELINITVTSL